jgi:hypothetical protein
MANKKILLGMLAVLLVFGASLVGCEYGDPGLEGTWKMTSKAGEETQVATLTFTSGDVEYKIVVTGSTYRNETQIMKGTYVASNGQLGMTMTYYSADSIQISPYNQCTTAEYVIYGNTLIISGYGVFTKE